MLKWVIFESVERDDVQTRCLLRSNLVVLYSTVATGDGCTQGGNLCVTRKLTYKVYFNASSIYWEDLS